MFQPLKARYCEELLLADSCNKLFYYLSRQYCKEFTEIGAQKCSGHLSCYGMIFKVGKANKN